MPIYQHYELNNKPLGKFHEGSLSVSLTPDDNKLYIVSNIESQTRRDSISKVKLRIKPVNGEEKTVELKLRTSSSNSANSNLYGKSLTLGFFQVDSKGKYNVDIVDVNKTAGVQRVQYLLHKNSGRYLEGTLIILGLVAMFIGFASILFDLFSSGITRLIQKFRSP